MYIFDFTFDNFKYHYNNVEKKLQQNLIQTKKLFFKKLFNIIKGFTSVIMNKRKKMQFSWSIFINFYRVV